MSALRNLNRVAIIGRPNVGKSTLFNILTRSRKSVVRNEPGVTRDVIVEPAEWWGEEFDVVDTGGITDAEDEFSPLIKAQVLQVLKSVDLLILVMDGKSGLMPEDRDLVRIAKESGRPVYMVVNKVDRMQNAELVLSEFYEFGIDLLAASFERRDGIDKIVDWIRDHLPEKTNTQRTGVRIAVVGKPNVGKSSLCNKLLKKDRMLVSDVAGTTVDAIEEQFQFGNQDYILVDTAGLRRSSKRKDGVEFLSAVKSHSAIDRADVVLVMVDTLLGVTVQEAKIVQYILDQHKPVILVANKIDQAKVEIEAFRKGFREKVKDVFHFFPDIPLCFISAHTGAGVEKLFATVENVWEKINIRIKTSQLNDFFFQTIRKAPAPVWGSRNVKFYYLTQTNQRPPSFITFANHPEGVTPSYRRFLVNQIQDHFDLKGIPIRIFVMKSKSASRSARGASSDSMEEYVPEMFEGGDFNGFGEFNEFDDEMTEGMVFHGSEWGEEREDNQQY